MDTEVTVHNALSYSDLETLARCPKSFDYKAVQRLQAKRRSVPLYLGSLVHEQLKAYYLGTLIEERERQYSAAEDVLLDDAVLGGVNLVDEATMLVDSYIGYYVASTWTPLHVEEQFIAKLYNGRTLSFTPDLVVEDGLGDVWVVDHKTTRNSRPAGWSPMQSMSLQPLIYLSGVQSVYPNTRGFIFDYIRKKVPTMPRLTQKGTVADINRIDTTFEVLNQFIQTHAPHLQGDPVHQAKLQELWETNKFFWRETVYATPQLLAQGMADVTDWMSVLEEADERARWPRSFRDCSRCEFAPLCHSELLVLPGTDMLRAEQYQPREPKNVYEAEGDEE